MIYINNTINTQDVWIPRNDGQGAPHKPSTKLEIGEITVTADTQTNYPSSGYIGFSSVVIDSSEYAQHNYDLGYSEGENDGYISGVTDGEQSVIDTFTSTTITENGQYGSSANPYSSVTVNIPQTGHTDEELQESYQSGFTSGETHQKSLLGTTAFTENGSYSAENGYSAITVNVPQTGTSLNIEANHSFTATSNGNYTIKPSDIWSITYDHTFARRYDFTINGTIPQSFVDDTAYVVRYYDETTEEEPSVAIKVGSGNTLYLNKNGWDEDDYGDVDFRLYQGKYRLEFDNDDLDSSEFSIIPYSNGEKYDVMSAVTLNVNVDTASTYQSGYTSGYTEGYNSGYTSGETDGYQSGYTVGTNDVISTFTATTATTNGVYGSSANPLSSITVNVPQTGGTSVKYVEYLETDGGLLAWDTSVRITDINDVVYFDFMPINWGSGQSPVGSWFPFLIDGDGSDNFNTLIRCFLFDTPADGLCFEAFDYADYKGMKYNGFTADTRNNCIFDKNSLTINESVIQFSASNVFNTRTICINGEFNGEGGPVFKSAMGRYYSFKLIHSGQTISDLRPCLDGNDVPCFYDEVSQTYIYHSGSGTPIAGPIVDESYESGYTDGQNSIISTFTATTATTNGVYGSSANPLSSITVNVPTSSGGSEDFAKLIDRSITEVVIPSGVTKIGNNVFYDCTSLSSVTIPNSVTSIESSAFYYCTSLSSVTIPDSVTSIGRYAFYYCTSLSSVTIPNGVRSISNYSFDHCTSLLSVTIPSGVTQLETFAFNACRSLSSVTIQNGVRSIGSSAFLSCTSLSSVTIPDSIGQIGSSSFQNCSALTEVNIGSGVYKIDSQAFRNCSALTNVYISATTAPIIYGNTFQGVPSTGTVHYPQGSDYSSWQSNTYLSGWTFIADL